MTDSQLMDGDGTDLSLAKPEPPLRPGKRMRKTKPHSTAEIDRFIGMRIRERRTMLGMSQRELAKSLGVAHYIISKHELGDVGLSATRLYEIARLLDVSPESFFNGFDDYRSTELPAKQALLLNFMRSLGQIDTEAHRKALARLVATLAARE